MDPKRQARFGTVVARVIGVCFLLLGVRTVYVVFIHTDLWWEGLIGALMIWIGAGLWQRRDAARKAAVAIAVLYVLGGAYALYFAVLNNRGAGWVVLLAGVTVVMAAFCVLLLLPATRSVFTQPDVSDSQDQLDLQQ
jgi:hypothetical protein